MYRVVLPSNQFEADLYMSFTSKTSNNCQLKPHACHINLKFTHTVIVFD